MNRQRVSVTLSLIGVTEAWHMKYQQLENLEAGWKWAYLVKKWKDGDAVTKYIDADEANTAVNALLALEHEPRELNSGLTSTWRHH